MSDVTAVAVGPKAWPVAIPPEKRVELRHAPHPAPAAPPRELVRAALERPHAFDAPLRRALTPDDRVAVVLDTDLPHVAGLFDELRVHLESAGVSSGNITAIVPPGSGAGWVNDLPDEAADVTVETHDPADRKRLAYMASTKSGRRVYLNRTLVDADFVVVLTGRRFDPVRGVGGGLLGVYPDLSDEETRAANAGPYTSAHPWPGREEAEEVAKLFGMPFLVQVIEGDGDDVQEVVAGFPNTEAEGRNRQAARWKSTATSQADAVVATVTGSADRITFADLAKAAACAAKLVKPGGRIALLTDAAPPLGEAAEMIRTLDEPRPSMARLQKEKPADWAACRQWCKAARTAGLFVASGYPDELVEELFATPLHTPSEVQRLIDAAETVALIPDAHKARVVVEEGSST